GGAPQRRGRARQVCSPVPPGRRETHQRFAAAPALLIEPAWISCPCAVGWPQFFSIRLLVPHSDSSEGLIGNPVREGWRRNLSRGPRSLAIPGLYPHL